MRILLTLAFVLLALPLEAQVPLTLIHRQQWDEGNGIWGSAGSYVFYERASDGPDPDYGFLYVSDGLQANATGGRTGGPCLDLGGGGAEWRFSGWWEKGFGSGIGGEWDASNFTFKVWVYMPTAMFEESAAPNNILFWIPNVGGFPSGMEVRFYKWLGDGNFYFRVHDGAAGNFDNADEPFPRATFENQWVELTGVVKASTSGDGYVRLYADGASILEFNNIDFEPVTGGTATYGAPGGYALGFAGLSGKQEDFRLYSGEGEEEFEPPTPGPYEDIEDVSDPCCGSGSDTPTQGQTGDIPQVSPYMPHNPGPSTTTCVGGGTVPTAADLTDPEDWTTLLGATPNVLCELVATKHPSSLGSTTYRWADQGLDLPLSSAHAEGRVRRGGWSEIRRAMAMPDQYPEISRAGVTIDEQDALIRTLQDTESTAYLKGREYVEWLVSETRRKASGTMMALFRGVVSFFNPGPGRTYTIEVEDHLTSPFGVFDLDKPIPQALIDHTFFGPGGDDGTDIFPVRYGGEQAGQLTRGCHKDLIGAPIPILGGICSDAGSTSIDGQSAEKGAVPLIWTRDCYLPGHGDQIFGEMLVGLGRDLDVERVFGSDCGYDGLTPADPPRAPKRVSLADDHYGVDVFVPHHTASWPFETAFRSRTVGDETLDYVAIYMRGPIMEHHRLGLITITANVCGPKGQNGQVINQVGPFLQWFYNEHVAANEGQGYRSGEYHALATYASDATVPYLQPTTFAEFQDYSKERMGDDVGYVVENFQLRERITLRELERRFMQDYEVSFPINRHGQKMLRWVNWTEDPDTGTLYRERIEIDEPLPPYVDAHDEIENIASFVCGRDHDTQTWRREAETLKDEDSILAHKGTYQSGKRLTDGQSITPMEVYSTAHIATVRDCMARRLARKGRAARYQEATTDLQGLHDELGDQIRMTHSRGVGASGYQERPFQIHEHRIDVNRKRVTFRSMDLTRLQSGTGVAAPDDAPEWASATDEDKALYVYAAADDGTVGDEPGKRAG